MEAKLNLSDLSNRDIEMKCSNIDDSDVSSPMSRGVAESMIQRRQVIWVLKQLKNAEELFNIQLNRGDSVECPTHFISSVEFTHPSVKKAAEMSGWALIETTWLGRGFSSFSLSKKGTVKRIFVSEE